MGSYKKQFMTLLTYNALQGAYSNSTVSSLPSYGNDLEDRPSDIRVEPDDQTAGVALVGHKAYRFITLDSGSGSVISGDAVLIKDTLGSVGTTVFASGIGGRNLVAGVGIGALTPGNRGWVQIRGFHAGLNTAGNGPAAADVLWMSGVAKQFNKTAANTAPTNIPAGVATSAEANNLTPARLMIPE